MFSSLKLINKCTFEFETEIIAKARLFLHKRNGRSLQQLQPVCRHQCELYESRTIRIFGQPEVCRNAEADNGAGKEQPQLP